ncbi:MAG: KaiC domain-containing protein [Thermotogae bacterium]|nr:KaiC domain-containing protein [Thermotogota bacterium]
MADIEKKESKYDSKPFVKGVKTLEEAGKEAPKLEGVPTGVEGLDELFFTSEIKDGKVQRVPLGGIPKYAVINITGVSDTGKSLLVEQFAVKRAGEGERVVFVTVESPAPFVALALKERAKAMGFKDLSTIDKNVVLIDAASYTVLRESMQTLLDTLAYAIRTYRAQHTVIDSITGLYESKEMMARAIVRQLFNFMKKWYQTALFVSQKRSGHEELSAEAAGGYAVSHIVDCTFVMSKKLIITRYDESIYGRSIGEMVRLFRIDGCRMCGHDTDTHFMEIDDLGLIKIGPSLKVLRKKEG